MTRGTRPALLDLPLEVLALLCLHLDLIDITRVAKTCKRFRHGGSEMDKAELPTMSPVITALRQLAFPHPQLVPSTRPMGESWVEYFARCALQRRCSEAPLIAAGWRHSLFVDAAGQLLACGKGAAVGHGDLNTVFFAPTPVAAMAGIRVRSVAVGSTHSLAVSWDGRVYSWGQNGCAELGHGDRLARPSPTMVEGLENVVGISATVDHSLAVTQSGRVFRWGQSHSDAGEDTLRPVAVDRFGGVRVCRVCTDGLKSFAIGEEGELFSWGRNLCGILGHGDVHYQPTPKRVEALRGVRVNSVSAGWSHALALTEDGLVYTWGENTRMATMGNPCAASEMLPRPVERLRGVRVSSVAVAGWRNYAVADTGELWAWGVDRDGARPLGHGEQMDCAVPKPIQALRGVKVDAVSAGDGHTLALADDGGVYVWGGAHAARTGALGLGPSVRDARGALPMSCMPRRLTTLAPLTR